MANNLSKRYQGEFKDFLRQASALDPRFKSLPTLSPEKRQEVWQSLGTLIVECCEGCSLLEVRQEVAMKEGPEDTYEPGPTTADDVPPLPALPQPAMDVPVARPSTSSISTSPPPAKKSATASAPCSALDDICGDIYVTKVVPAPPIGDSIKAELQRYQTASTISMQDCPLAWWKAHQADLPLMARAAR